MQNANKSQTSRPSEAAETEENLQSTIEQLQIANRELMASNRELRFANEKLSAVSSEHQRKIGELTELTDDMNDLLQANEIGIIFLDKELRVRMFTPFATTAFNLIAKDVGRPISNVTYNFDNVDLGEIVDKAMSDGGVVEKEIAVDNAVFMLRVMPYSASNDEDAGVVITVIDISELKAAQMAEKQTATLYEQVVTDLSEFVIRWSADDGVISYCNKRYADIVGKSMGELIGYPVDDVIPQQSRIQSEIETLVAPGQSARYYVTQVGKDGQKSVRSGIVRALGDESGRISTYQATGIDITEHNRYQQALEALLNVGEGALDSDHDPIVDIMNIGSDFFQLPCGFISQIVDDDLRIQHVTNVSPMDDVLLEGDHIPIAESVFTPGPDEELLIDTHIDRQDRRVMNFRRGPANVETISVVAFISTRIMTCNEPYGTLTFYGSHSMLKDFSDEQKTFAKLLSHTVGYQLERNRQLENAMRRRQHYQQLYYQTPVMMCTVDRSACLLEANEEFLSQLGYARHDVIGRSLDDFVVDDSSPAATAATLRESLKKSKLRKTPVDLGTVHGSLVRTELSAIRRTELDSDETSYLLVLEDVTERDFALGEARHQKEELQASNEGLSQFAYIASHDLQEPLRKIRQFGEMLDKEYTKELSGDGVYYLSVITSASQRISTLVRDLLDYSRTSNAQLALTPMDLQQTFKDVITDLDAQISDANAKVTSNELPTVIADKVAVSHLFRNLISNGLKYQAQDKTPELSVTASSQQSKTVIHFTDNGIGMSGDVDQRIFEPFVRLEKRSKYSGTGIGLAICKTVCDRLNWGISYQSNAGSGTTFSVSIPKKSLILSNSSFGRNSQ